MEERGRAGRKGGGRSKGRKVRSKAALAPQIVTLTNEQGDLIKAIISVGGDGREEQVVEQKVEERTVLYQSTNTQEDILYVMES